MMGSRRDRALPTGAVLTVLAVLVVALGAATVAAGAPGLSAADADDVLVQQSAAEQKLTFESAVPADGGETTVSLSGLPDGVAVDGVAASTDDPDVTVTAERSDDEAVVTLTNEAAEERSVSVSVTLTVDTTAAEPTTGVSYPIESTDSSTSASFDLVGPDEVAVEPASPAWNRTTDYATSVGATGNLNRIEAITVTIPGADADGAENLRVSRDGGSSFQAQIGSDVESFEASGETISVTFDGTVRVDDDWAPIVLAADDVRNPDAETTNATVVVDVEDSEPIETTVPIEYEAPDEESGDLHTRSGEYPLAFAGQAVVAEGFLPGETVHLRTDDGELQQETIATNVGHVLVETADRQGNYVLVGTESGTEIQFEVAEQTLDATVEPDRVTTDESATLTVDSNRATFDLAVGSDDLDDEGLAGLFGVDAADVENGTVEIEDADGTHSLHPSAVEPRTYELALTVPDSTAVTNVTLSVVSPGMASVEFTDPLSSAATGDEARLDLDLDATETATVRIGSEELNYVARVVVADESGDGSATLAFNTARAGSGAEAFRGLDGAAVRSVEEETTIEPGDPIEPHEYPLEVAPGGLDEPSDVGTLYLSAGWVDGATTAAVPAGSDIDAETLANTSERSEVAAGDIAVVKVDASGVFGYLLADGKLDSAHDLSMGVEQQKPSLNRDPITFNESSDAVTTVADPDQEYVLFALDTEAMLAEETIAPGQEYDVSFTVGENNSYVADRPATANATVELVRPQGVLAEPVVVEPGANQTIRGETTLAPGTELLVVAESRDTVPFVKRSSSTVQSDGSFAATFDFSDVPPGSTYRVSVEALDLDVDGEVVESIADLETTPTVPELPTETADETPIATGTPAAALDAEEADDSPDADENAENAPGGTIAGALFALAAAIVLAARRIE